MHEQTCTNGKAQSRLNGRGLPLQRLTAEQFARQHGGRRAKRSGAGWSISCPAHEDKHPSASVRDGENGGLLFHCHAGCAQDDLLAAVRALGVDPSGLRNQAPRASAKGVNGKCANGDAEPTPAALRHGKHGEPSRVWTYHTLAGELHHVRARYQMARGGKEVLPWRYNGTRWECKEPDGPFPLYCIPDLIERAADPVLVVEGERTADAAASAFSSHVVTTSAGGSGAAAKSDWSPLQGRTVVIWPDNDKAGAKYANSVAELAHKAGAKRVAIVAVPPTWTQKWDLADDLHEGVTYADLTCMIADAKAWEPAPEPPPATQDRRNRRNRTSRARDHSQSQDPSPSVTGPTDCDLADAFAAAHSHELRYCAAWSKWLRYDGKVWKVEPTNLARSHAKDLCQKVAGTRSDAEARRIASAKTVAGVQTLAAADRRIAATVEQWDADPWLLNTPGGVVDLRTGEMRRHQPDDHMARITTCAAAGECPLWLQFLDTTFGRDAELIAYMQRVAGYSLTGSTREQAMFFGYGTGGNGKSVYVDTITGILGDYAITAPIETFTMSPGDRHPTELAMLHGARLVTAIETEEGRRWAESRIKALTGGDRIAARFMRQDFFEFKPQFKLLIAGNHKPALRTVDEAIRRRFNLIPFSATISAEKRDPKLAKRLQPEWPGILQWAVDGCVQWQKQGLCPPKAVADATSDYLAAEDAFGAWIKERCEVDANASQLSSQLYASWKEYAEGAGEAVGPLKAFRGTLESRGFLARHTRTGTLISALRVRPQCAVTDGDGRQD